MLKAKPGERVCWLHLNWGVPLTAEIRTGELQEARGTYLRVWPDGDDTTTIVRRGDLYRITPENVAYLKTVLAVEELAAKVEEEARQAAGAVRKRYEAERDRLNKAMTSARSRVPPGH